MRLILIDATSEGELTLGEGYIDPKEKGRFTLYLFKSGVEHLKLNLSPVASANVFGSNQDNSLNYVGSIQQPVTLYIDSAMRSRDIQLTAIYVASGERHHIYLYATPSHVEAEDLARGVLNALRKKLPVPREHPLVDITQMKLGKLALDYETMPETVSVFA